MTNNPWRVLAREPETLQEAVARADAAERLLVALAVHAPTIVDLANIGNEVSGRRQTGALVAYRRMAGCARVWLTEDAKPRRAARRAAASRKEAAR